MHGIDWNLMKSEYAAKLPSITNNRDLARMMEEMMGELNASHTGTYYRSRSPNADSTAGLGLILDLSETLSVSVNNKKLIIRKVNNDFSQPRQAVTGKREFYLLGYNKDPQVTVTQTAPMFIQVNGLVAEVSF